MFGDLFDSNNRKKKRDNLERYDDKRRGDNNRGGSGGGGNGEGDDDRERGSKGPNRQNLMIMLLATVIALVVISYVMNMGSESATRISYNEFVQLVGDGKVEEVNVRSDRLEIKLKDSDAIRYTSISEEETDLTKRLLDAGVTGPAAAASWAGSARARPRKMGRRTPASRLRTSQVRTKPRNLCRKW